MKTSPQQPPRLAVALVRLIRDREAREFLLGDLAEEFNRRVQRGYWRAVVWYVSQTLRSAFSLKRSRRGTTGGSGGRLREALIVDARDAFRGLAARPGLTAVIVTALALGLGVNAAMLGIADAVLFRPLPYPEPDRLLWIHTASDNQTGRYGELSYQDVARLQETSLGLQWVGAYSRAGRTVDANGADPMELDFARVTSGFFEAIGVSMHLGRGLSQEESAAGAQLVVLSYDYWQNTLRSDPDVLQKDVRIRGVAHQVIGVASPDMTFPPSAAFWRPLTLDEREDDDRELNAVARLTPGTSVSELNARLATASPDLVPTSEDDRPLTLWAETMRSTMVQSARGPVLTLVGGALVVLLIGCANVANLLVARSEERRHTLALRCALGASRARLVRLQLLESLILATSGGLAGIVAGAVALPTLIALAPAETPRIDQAAIDVRVIVGMLAIVFLTTIVAGLMPAMSVSHITPRQALGGIRLGSRVSARGRRLLVAVQVALSTVLAVSATLLVATVARMSASDLGFSPNGVLAFQLFPSRDALDAQGGMLSYQTNLMQSLSNLPGVSQTGFGSHSPTEGRGINARILRTVAVGDDGSDVQIPPSGIVEVAPTYFDVNGITLMLGRTVGAGDVYDAPNVALVNQRFAQSVWGRTDNTVLGKRLKALDVRAGGMVEIEVVGLVNDVRPNPRLEPEPLIYRPITQMAIGFPTLFVASIGQPASLLPELRQRLRTFDPGLPLNRVQFLEESVSAVRASPTFLAQLLIAFGALALVLAMLGSYSVMSWGVVRRGPEFGLRRALGAQPSEVFRLVFREAGWTVVAGVGLGLFGAFLASRLFAAALYNVNRLDIRLYLGVALAVALAALAAGALPAHRAARMPPTVALLK